MSRPRSEEQTCALPICPGGVETSGPLGPRYHVAMNSLETRIDGWYEQIGEMTPENVEAQIGRADVCSSDLPWRRRDFRAARPPVPCCYEFARDAYRWVVRTNWRNDSRECRGPSRRGARHHETRRRSAARGRNRAQRRRGSAPVAEEGHPAALSTARPSSHPRRAIRGA